MFNAEQKEEYLRENEGRNVALRKTMQFIFGSTESIETALDKDAAEWTATEIIEYFKSLSTSSFTGLANRHSQLRQYAQWCLDNNVLTDNQNHYEEIDYEVLKGCINAGQLAHGILTRKEMEKEITQLLNAREQCLIYALFEGVQGKEFVELTELNMSQVRGNTLRLATRTIPVNPRLISLMQEATDEYVYYAYGKGQRKYAFDASDDNVFKRMYNSKEETQIRKRQRLYSNLQRVKDYLGNPAINTTSLVESGRIDMISAFMKEDGTELEETLRNHREEMINKYGDILSVPSYIITYGEFY